MPLTEMLATVARRHERRTGKPVECRFGTLPDEIAFPIKTCIYRVAQEGLNNAFRHASGRGQRLVASATGSSFEIGVSDEGPGFAANGARTSGQGLQGLRDRIESLGGEMEIITSASSGTQLIARFKLPNGTHAHG
jgi:signal transduction histidine kinase